MALLDEVASCSDSALVCRLKVRGDGLFNAPGGERAAAASAAEAASSAGEIPAWLGIEYMAQAVAAFSGLQHWRNHEPVRVGFLLGTRRFATNVAAFQVGQCLEVHAARVIQGDNGMGAFKCRVTGGGVEQSATLSVFEPAPEQAAAMLQSRGIER